MQGKGTGACCEGNDCAGPAGKRAAGMGLVVRAQGVEWVEGLLPCTAEWWGFAEVEADHMNKGHLQPPLLNHKLSYSLLQRPHLVSHLILQYHEQL